MSQDLGPSLRTKTVSLLGCGWLGLPLAGSLQAQDVFVRGSTTNPSRISILSSLGVEPLLLRIEPLEDGDVFSDSPAADRFFSSMTLVINIPPETALGADYHPGQISAILARVNLPDVQQILYVSSTSVYGSHQGRVNEITALEPDQGSGQILRRTEKMLSDYALKHSIGLTIVRPGGLIGPGRHPGLFLAGRKGAANGESPVNLIHQLDLGDLLTSLIVDHPTPQGSVEIYNAVSSHHPLRSEFYPRAALAIGVEPPTFAANENPPTKFVLSEKIRQVTGCLPRFDDLYESIGAGSTKVDLS
jgi:nucleoside-diphosphate-sugar epimerase